MPPTNNTPPDPPKPPPTIDAQLETLAGLGHTESEAALLLGLTLDKFQKLIADATNSVAWERGRTKADHQVLKSLFQNACAGNVQAQQYWVESRMPERWGKKKPTTPLPDNPAQNCPAFDPLATIRLT